MSAAKRKYGKCFASGCKNHRSQDNRKKGITFHRFPNRHKFPELYDKWTSYCGREAAEPSDYRRMCSVHFEEELFDRTGQTVRLRQGAVPSVPKSQIRRREENEILRPLLLSSATPEEFSKTHSLTIDEIRKKTQSTIAKQRADILIREAIARQRAVDHPYSLTSLSDMKRKVLGLEKRLEDMSVRLRNSLRREHRTKKNSDRLEGKIHDLNMVNRDLRTKINTYKAIPYQLFSKPANGDYTKKQRDVYQTIDKYSRKTYNYLRDVCGLSLPCPRTLRRWRSEFHEKTDVDPALLKVSKEEDSVSHQQNSCGPSDGDTIDIHIDGSTHQYLEVVDSREFAENAEEVLITLADGGESGPTEHSCVVPVANENTSIIPGVNENTCVIPGVNENTCVIPSVNKNTPLASDIYEDGDAANGSNSLSGENFTLNDHSYDYQTLAPVKHLQLL